MRFYINNTLADFYEESDLAVRLTYRTIDVENIDLAGGNYALNLKLPKTFNNQQIFNFINRIEQDDQFWYNIPFTAIIESDGNIVFKGTLTVDKITFNDFECSLIGDNIDWSSNLDNSLRDIQSFKKILWSGVRSTLYNPFPSQYTNSVGYRDYWLDNTGTNSLKEENGLEFCLPLISYGNFPAPRTFADDNQSSGGYVPIPINAADAAGDDRWCFYNTLEDPLNWGSIFPCPYLKSTIINIFKDYDINVAGDFIIKEKYNNIFLPFTSSDQPQWNWGLLHRTDIEFTQRLSTLPNPNRVPFLPTSATNPNDQVQNINNGSLMDTYIKINFDDYDNYTHTPSDLTINELYMYNDSFFTKVKSQFSNRYFAFNSQAAGTYRITWDIKGFTAFPFATLTESWHNSANTNTPGFYFLLVKKPNESIRGINDVGLVDFNNHLVLDPQVVGSLFFDTTTGAYDNLVSNPIDFTISADVEMDELETIELYFCSIHTLITGVAGFGNAIRFEIGETSRLTVEPLDLPITLNPAKFLPDFSQRDLLKSVLNMYNLFLYYDANSNTVFLNEYENYFLPPSSAIDWSDKCSLDDDSLTIESGFTFRQVNLKLLQDENDIYELLDNIPTDLTIDNNMNYWNQVKDIELIHTFTSTRNYYVNGDTLYPNGILADDIRGLETGDTPRILFSIDIPTMSSEAVYEAQMFELYEGDVIRSYDFAPRLLKYIGIKPMSISKNFYVEDIAFHMVAGDFFYPYAAQEDATTEFNPRFQGVNNLSPAWQRWITLVNKKTNISLDCYLTARDIANIDIRRPVKIGNQLFIISSINEYNPVELTTTKINLYKK